MHHTKVLPMLRCNVLYVRMILFFFLLLLILLVLVIVQTIFTNQGVLSLIKQVVGNVQIIFHLPFLIFLKLLHQHSVREINLIELLSIIFVSVRVELLHQFYVFSPHISLAGIFWQLKSPEVFGVLVSLHPVVAGHEHEGQEGRAGTGGVGWT